MAHDAAMTKRRIIRDEGDTETKLSSETQPESVESEPLGAGADLADTVSPAIPLSWANVIDDIKRVDVWSMYERLRNGLTFGSDLVLEYPILVRALDKADANFFDSVKLHRAAKLEEERFTRSVDEQMGALRKEARAELEQAKADGKLSKAPTLEMVADKCLENWPDLVATLTTRKAELHGATQMIEQLSVAWRSRAESLRLMAKKAADVERR